VSTLTIEKVREFWEEHPCAIETGTGGPTLEYFLEVERYRYENAPFIRSVARFDNFHGKRVLEVGCGLGTDGAQFAQSGADYTGVDLTDASIELAARNFAVRDLPGEFVRANAEALPFDTATFDHVWSFGVIHHTSSPRAVVNEIERVLRPGGTVAAMVYNRTSINYYVEIMLLRKVGRALLRPAWAPGLLARTFKFPEEKLRGHRNALLSRAKPTSEEWVSMNTDGPDCPLSRVYSAAEAKDLFGGFDRVETDVHLFDRSHWPFIGKRLPARMVDTLAARAGWCRMVYGHKPSEV
jgi:SAM-dependent methyltransferase